MNKVLSKRKNVKIMCNSEVVGYDIDSDTKMAKSVILKNGKKITSDLVILCNGPEAPFHMADCLDTILPSIQGQGYSFDVTVDDKSMHKEMNVMLRDSIYSIGQYTPGKHRHAALLDFGLFKEPFYDEKRWDYIKNCLAKDYGIKEDQVDKRVTKKWVGRRPLSPDGFEIIGPMK